MARLGDIATYINGYAFKPSDWSDKGIPIVRIQDLTGNAYQANFFDGECAPKYEVNNGDVLISWSASLGVYIWNSGRAVLNQHIFKVVFDKAEVSKSFFVHQVSNILEKAASEAHGATMKHLTKPVFDGLEFYLPPMDEQKRIAAKLDCVSDLITKHQQQLSKLDELVKSRFIELFGDCHDTVSIKDSELFISDGNYSAKYPRSDEFVESGIPFIRANNLKDCRVIDEDMYYISAEKHSILLKGHLRPNDILITTRGNIGQVAIVPARHNDSNINAQIVLLRDIHHRFNPWFLLWALQTDEVVAQYGKLQTGTALKQLPVGRLEQVVIKNPPIDVQNEFAAFVEQTDKLKFEIKQSLEELETLKKALMQKYFG